MDDLWAKDEKSLSAQNSIFTMRLHRRQFVIGQEAFCAHDNWCCRQLDASIWVSYCPELRVGWANDVDGGLWGLFGLAIETCADRPEPLAQIALASSADVPNLYDGWAGRWVLIGRDQVHMDASGLLGCFYGTATDSRIWVSSSPALLAQVLSPGALSAVSPRQLCYETGISWFTPPRSGLAGIFRLLPSQVIDYADGSIRPRPLMPPIDPARSYNETLKLLKDNLVTAIRRLPLEGSRLWLSLSAGADSRLVMAAAHCASVDGMPFTRVSARMSLADRLLPPKLAHELGYEHVFLQGRSYNPDRKHLVAEHSAGHVSDGDALPLLQGMRDSLKGISTGGWCFGVGKVLNRRSLPDAVNDPEVVAQQIAQAYGEPLTSTATASVREWLEWTIETPQEHLDWRDRFYIEQRLAGWQSSKEQVYDLSEIERFPVINAARNYALLLGLEEGCRVDAKHQVELIHRIAPELLKYPCNPPDKYFGILRELIIKSSNDPLYVYRKVARKLRRMWRSLQA